MIGLKKYNIQIFICLVALMFIAMPVYVLFGGTVYDDTDYDGHNMTSVGNITGDDVDINAGTGDYTTTGTVEGTAYIIGANTLDTNEWAYLDGQDQSTSKSSDVTFNKVHLDTDGTYLSRDVTGNLHLVDDVTGDYTLDNLTMDSLGAATYQYIQDWVNTTQSAGKINASSGALSDSGGGEIDVASGTGFIKTTDNALGTTEFFDWSAESNISLTDNSMNYLYIDYNSGSPQVGVTTTRSNIHFTDQIGLGRVYREGTTLTILSGGVQLQDSTYRTHKRLAKVDGFIRATGCATSMTGLKVAVTSGTFYYGITPLSATALDTAAADTITYIYSDGASGWTSVTGETDIDNTYYDDGDGTLGTLTVNQYGTHWLYWAAGTSDFYVVYGTGSYKLNEAQETTIPALLPPALTNMGLFVARIIIEKSAAAKEQIDAPWDTPLGGSGVTDHGDLAGLSDDDHPQYSLVDGTRAFTGFPDTPSSAPTTNYDIANKKYVDDSVAAAGGGDITSVWSAASGAANQLTIGESEYLIGGAVDGSTDPYISLPQGTDVSSVTGEGCISWDSDNDKLYIGDGVAVVEIGTGSGDNVSIDSVAVVDPDFVSTGDIDFVDTSNTVTANIQADKVTEVMLKCVNAAVDEYVLTYESTTGDFEWKEAVSWRYIDLPAGAWDYPTSNPAPLDTDPGTNNTIKRHVFDDTTNETIIAQIMMPSDLDTSGTVTFQLYGYATTASAVATAWSLYHNDIDSGETWDGAYTEEYSGAKTGSGSQDFLDEHSWAETVSNLGWVADDMVRVKLTRAAGNDALSGDYGVVLFRFKIPRN